MNITPWPKADQRWYLGVRCKKCRLPILFALDHSDGVEDYSPPSPAGKLVLTCPLDKCRFQADYTATSVSRFQKDPAQTASAERNNESNKSRKRS